MTDAASHLAGQTAIVTGASNGIGKALTHQLLDAGVRVAMVGRDKGRLERAAGDADPAVYMALECDVRDDSQVRAMTARVAREWGRADILVNCAGLYMIGPLTELTNDVWDDLWRTNVNGTIFPTRAVLPGMLERKHGIIVVLSSVAAHRGFANNTAYAATKYAVTGFARALTTEVRRKGVRVVNAFIGPVDTEMWADKSLPLERGDMLTPHEVASAIINAITVSDRQVLEDILLLPQAGIYT
ncbi:MAG: SDR family oxidoreductase [Dehalococcoidia bacterium]